MNFSVTETIKVYDTDVAGILFFGSIYRLMHNAFEAYLAEKGFPLADIVHQGEILIPVVHSEADYKLPMRAGDVIAIEVVPEKMGNSSVTMLFVFKDGGGRETARGKIIFATIRQKDWKKIPFPDNMRRAFSG